MGDQVRDESPLSRWLRGLSHDLPDGEVAGYVALGGGDSDQPARGFAIVQLPVAVGPAAIGQHMERSRQSVSERIAAVLDAHARYARELEDKLAEATAYIEELERERDGAGQGEAGGEAVRALEARVRELEVEVRQWRQRAAVAEGEALRVRLEAQAAGVEAQAERLAAVEAELDDTRAKLERATRNWRDAEAKSDSAWRRVGEIQTELDLHREQAVARSAQQRRASQLELAKAREDASMKLIGVRDQLLRCDKRRAELEAELSACEAARAELTARLQAGED